MSLAHTSPPLVIIRSDKDDHFTDEIAQDAKEDESLVIPGVGRTNELIIESVIVQADQQLEWDVFFWGTSGFDDSDLDLDRFAEYVNFKTTKQKQIAGSGQYYLAWTNLGISYRDLDSTSKVHVSVVNRSSASKAAGSSGEFVLELRARPLYFT